MMFFILENERSLVNRILVFRLITATSSGSTCSYRHSLGYNTDEN